MTKRVAPLASTPLLEVGQYSHRGQKRTNNEDWLGAFQSEPGAGGGLFLVADGMGGHQSGELASRQAVDQVIRHFAHDVTRDVGTRLREAIESANDSLYGQGGDGPPAGRSGTTLVAALVHDGRLLIANVGDSRAYLLRANRLQQISRDHSLGGEMGAALGKNWIGRHVITRALGVKPQVKVDVYPPLGLNDGDRIVLCSDGLTGTLTDQEIAAIAGSFSPQEAATRLVHAANQKGAADNVSVIVVGVSRPPLWHARIGHVLTMLARPGGVAHVWTLLAADRQLLAISIGVLLLAILIIVGLGFAIGLLFWGSL